MFSRRHPYLYFLLVLASVLSSAAVVLSLVLLAVIHGVGIGDAFQSAGGQQVGVIEITGVIWDAGDTLEALKDFRDDEEVRAIVVRVDSPGGGVGPSQEIYREIRKTREKKTVVASLGAVAASGGYYVAAGADKIVANPGTITGSIGVIMGFPNYEELMKKIGLAAVVVKSGRYKDIGSPVRGITPGEEEILETLTHEIHAQFIQDIVDGRGLEFERVRDLADGRIFTGKASLASGLVDRLGNIEDAIEWAGRLGGIEGEVTAVYAREKHRSVVDYLLMNSRLKTMVMQWMHPPLKADAILDPSAHRAGNPQ